MVVIRLARGGAKKRPFYNLVVADSRKPATGKFIERVGFYDPKAPEGRESLRVAMDRLSYWRNQGAKMSPTVARLVKTVEVPASVVPAPANAAPAPAK
ncbi:MAG: 30S ribosomal protein S16 [Betaproteobacteria bacterium RIFCSPLOWO2_12_FULL_65_110]|nr:MAG: 30S ribosomal protein S16 [Betaproteobacteria bacterium RIFCSPLOWO2_12_FULL_65_110]